MSAANGDRESNEAKYILTRGSYIHVYEHMYGSKDTWTHGDTWKGGSPSVNSVDILRIVRI